MPWFFWVWLSACFLFLIALSWPMISSSWWDRNYDWVEANEKRLNFFTRKDKELERILCEVKEKGKQVGFPPVRADIRMVRTWIKADWDGEAHHYTNQIYIFESSVQNFTPDDMRILIAHEWGHLLHEQTKRTKHPLFRKIKKFDREEFADFIAAYLYSKEMLLESAARSGYSAAESLKRIRNLEITRKYAVAP